MALKDRALSSIEREDLDELVEARVQEGRDPEFKRELPSNSVSEEKEYLADVSSFANAPGGVILY